MVPAGCQHVIHKADAPHVLEQRQGVYDTILQADEQEAGVSQRGRHSPRRSPPSGVKILGVVADGLEVLGKQPIGQIAPALVR